MSWLKNLFAPSTSPSVIAPHEQSPLLMLAIKLTKQQDAHWPDADGEFKRAKVYAQLINTFPEVNRRAVSRAIEEALECSE